MLTLTQNTHRKIETCMDEAYTKVIELLAEEA